VYETPNWKRNYWNSLVYYLCGSFKKNIYVRSSSNCKSLSYLDNCLYSFYLKILENFIKTMFIFVNRAIRFTFCYKATFLIVNILEIWIGTIINANLIEKRLVSTWNGNIFFTNIFDVF